MPSGMMPRAVSLPTIPCRTSCAVPSPPQAKMVSQPSAMAWRACSAASACPRVGSAVASTPAWCSMAIAARTSASRRSRRRPDSGLYKSAALRMRSDGIVLKTHFRQVTGRCSSEIPKEFVIPKRGFCARNLLFRCLRVRLVASVLRLRGREQFLTELLSTTNGKGASSLVPPAANCGAEAPKPYRVFGTAEAVPFPETVKRSAPLARTTASSVILRLQHFLTKLPARGALSRAILTSVKFQEVTQ